ncbi:MAG: hypothetical protein EOP24_34340 [Hyphomicrobiales bacterium]|nr:MAG: hypothetical protein EOP24_34340 [Hyphomicrobiales bacterium]
MNEAQLGRVLKHCSLDPQGIQVPNWRSLKPGDVILSSHKSKAKESPVYWKQKSEGYDDHACHWSHAMLYVGGLHVAESQSYFKVDGKLWPRTGTRVVPLTMYAKDNHLLVCRVKPSAISNGKRDRMVHHALGDIAAEGRRYDYARLIESLPYQKLASFIPGLWRNVAGYNEGSAVICTDFVLECLAIGGGVFVEEYRQVREKARFFYPADFTQHTKLDVRPMEYRLLVDDPTENRRRRRSLRAA